VVSHMGALSLGLILGYQIPGLHERYRWNKEMHQVQSQIDDDPKNAENWVTLGLLKTHVSDRDGALTAYRKATELDPSNVQAYLGVVGEYYSQGDFAAAEKWGTDALRIAQKKNDLAEIYTAQQILKNVQNRKAVPSHATPSAGAE
jgi:tetratricopeptide (TPR) repeat protein